MIQENLYSWVYGIAAVLLYALSCFHYRIYGEMILQFIYVGISIYGFAQWKKAGTSSISISRISFKELIMNVLAGIILSILFYLPLKYFNSSLPELDSISNGFAIVATYLSARKKIENWLLWIPINILVVYIMYLKAMPFYLILYICYALFAIFGYYKWKKSLSISQ